MAQDNVHLICESANLEEGGKGVRFALETGGTRPQPAFVVRYNAIPRAFINLCPHAGTELDWQPGEFFETSGLYLMCATHGAIFEPESGYCCGGPCKGRTLSKVPVEERDGHIYLAGNLTLHHE